MLNVSNSTFSSIPDPAIHVLMAILLLIIAVVFIINLILIVAIISVRDIPATIRLILTNIVASSEVVIIGLAILALYGIILTAQKHLQTSHHLCRLVYVLGASGGAARLLSMALYAVSMYFAVRYIGNNRRLPWWSFKVTVIALVALWTFAICPNIVTFSPDLVGIDYKVGDFCAAHITNHLGVTYSISYFVMYVVFSFVPAIVFPVLTLCHIRNNIDGYNPDMLRAMLKFAFFLLVGNSMNTVGIFLPILFVVFVQSKNDSYALKISLDYTAAVILVLSLIPTPIILLIFFRRVRRRFYHIICLRYINQNNHNNEARQENHLELE